MNGPCPGYLQFQFLELSKLGYFCVIADLNMRGLGEVAGLKKSVGKSYSRENPQVILKDLTVPVLIWRALSRKLGST